MIHSCKMQPSVIPYSAWALVWILALGSTLSEKTDIGDVLSEDPKVWEEDTLMLTCKVTKEIPDDQLNSRSLYFLQGNKSIPERYLTRVDSREINLNLTDINISHESTYSCHLNDSSEHLLVGARNVTVYRKPVKARRLDCMVYDWKWMSCTWDLGVKYYHPGDVNVSLVWAIKGAGRGHKHCPKYVRNQSCEWGSDFLYDMIYRMAVKVTNVVKNSSTGWEELDEVNSEDIVKPAPVQNLSAKPTNSSCVILQWDNKQQYRLKTCEIQQNSDPVLQLFNTSEAVLQTLTLCRLRPAVEYEISIRCRPRFKGFFSNISSTKLVMPEDAPSQAPEVTVGSYKLVEIPNSNGICQITVYWKPINENYRNGLITTYHLLVNGKAEIFNDTEDLEYNQVTLKVNCSRDYEITVRGGTEVGLSPVSSPPLLITFLGEKLTPPENFSVTLDGADENKVHLSWNKPETGCELATLYTIYYCQAFKDQQKCKGDKAKVDGDLQWIQLPLNQTNFTMVLPAASDGYMFGLSADTPHYSSGLVWSTCTYIQGRVPTNPPKNFRFADVIQDLSLTVRWEKYNCESGYIILHYTLQYCLLTGDGQNKKCHGPPSERQIHPSFSSYALTNLQDQQTYSISLRGMTDGGAGTATAWINGTSVKTGLSSGAIAGIAVAVVIVFCFAVFGLMICGRNFKKGVLDVTEIGIIFPPPVPDTDKFHSNTDQPDSDRVIYPQKSGNVTSLKQVENPQDEKKKCKESIMSDEYTRFCEEEDSKSSGLPDPGSIEATADNLGTVTTCGVEVCMLDGDSLKVPIHPSVSNSKAITPKQCLEVLPSQYQQNIAQHLVRMTGCDPQTHSSGNSQTASSDPITSYSRVDEMSSTCEGSVVSSASSGGVRPKTCYPNTHRHMSDGNVRTPDVISNQTTDDSDNSHVSSYIRVEDMSNTSEGSTFSSATSGGVRPHKQPPTCYPNTYSDMSDGYVRTPDVISNQITDDSDNSHVSSYIRVEDMSNTSEGSTFSSATSGGVRPHKNLRHATQTHIEICQMVT